jgi:hypothetical protein
MRRIVTTVLDLSGIASVVAGVALLSVPAAFIVGGVGLLAVSWRAAA